MLKGMQVPKEIKRLVEYHLKRLGAIKALKHPSHNYSYYMCNEHPDSTSWVIATTFNTFVDEFIDKYVPEKYRLNKNNHGMYVIMKDYSRSYNSNYWDLPYEKGIEFRIKFLTQVLAHINGTFTAEPRKQKMSDTKLYKALKAEMEPEDFKVVYENLKPIWKNWTTNKDSNLFKGVFKGFDTEYLWAAFDWDETPQGCAFWEGPFKYCRHK